jgi:precorrin-6A/cobalt-precorrin-6A reductase
MILLLGGTSDAAPLAVRLAEAGYHVLVSQATDTPLAAGEHPAITVRRGLLDDAGLAELVRDRGIRGLVDATHPYAAAIRRRAARVAAALGIPCLRFERPAALLVPSSGTPVGIEFVDGHAAAAAAAFAHRRAVLLTTGSRHLAPYVEQARRTSVPLVARVLDDRRSLEACRAAGILDEKGDSPHLPERPFGCFAQMGTVPFFHVVAGRGPFSVQENRRQIQAFGIGVLVTKDSGAAGGTGEKLEAARIEGCRVVVLRRPQIAGPHVFGQAEALLATLLRLVPPSG